MEDSGVMDLTRNVMIVSIVALFIMMMFLLFLHLYSKYYRTRFHARQQQQQQQQRGLDASILKTIPVIQFHPKDLDQLLECAVCLSELEEGDKARILPKCDHGFHVECIDMWLRSHSTCPICRNPLSDQTQTQQESTDGEDSNEVGTEEANDHHRIQTRGLPCEEASSSYKNIRARGDLVIDIPGQVDEDTSVSCSPTRSLKRMLSATARFNPFSPRTATASSNV